MGADFEVVQGDTATVFSDTLTYSTGNPADLTGATITFVMRSLVSASPLTLTGTASIVSAGLGTVQFAPGSSDVAVAGLYMAQWKVTFSNGKLMTFPTVGYLTVSIAENLTLAGGEQLVSLPDVKDYLSIPANDRANDSKLVRFIHAARPIVESITGPIIPTVFSEWHRGGGSIIQLRRRPSTAYATTPVLDVVADDDAPTLGVTEFWGSQTHPLAVVATPNLGSTYSCMVDPIGTITRLTSGGGQGCFPGGESVHVVYRAGQSTVPPNVYEGVLELLRVNYEQTQQVGTGRRTVADDLETGPPLAFYMPRRVREILAPNRRAPSIA